MAAKTYSDFDRERFVPETHSSTRSDFARDRGRLLHSSALRRLAAKTQVLSPTAGLDFARNRLTHSLEVAQIGRELANRLGVDADVVETACLAHDLGHPPFGHNGEKALSEWATECGGFEGNAQSFRLLVRLEPKAVDTEGVPRGLNLTRTSLLASIKYPWSAETPEIDPSGRAKFGVYADDQDVFEWARQGLPPRRLMIEAEIMDFSDDVAYSVHDFEDAIVNGYLDPAALASEKDRRDILHDMATWVGTASPDSLVAAWERLASVPGWVSSFQPSRAQLASLKNLTSTLIGRFALTASVETIDGLESLQVPSETRDEIALLKGLVAVHVMSHTARQPIYHHQRDVLKALATALAKDPHLMDAVFQADYMAATSDSARQRVVVDQVASLTDQSAMSLYERLGLS
ncbi:MAG: deoxyguanosinetriphosphate triphosphohydrolase [Pontimonas sp.]